MPVLSGNTSSSATSTAYDIPCSIRFFSLVNKSGGAITVNVGVLYGSTVAIIPYNLSMAAGDTLISNNEILIPVGHQVYISTSGSLDYYFVLE